MITTLKLKKIVIEDTFIADTFLKRLCGYMFRKKPHYNAIMIKPCSSIHTFFMQFNIDVLFLNENMKVIKKIENLRSSRIIMPVKGAKIVIEAKAGSFNEITVGNNVDKLFEKCK